MRLYQLPSFHGRNGWYMIGWVHDVVIVVAAWAGAVAISSPVAAIRPASTREPTTLRRTIPCLMSTHLSGEYWRLSYLTSCETSSFASPARTGFAFFSVA